MSQCTCVKCKYSIFFLFFFFSRILHLQYGADRDNCDRFDSGEKHIVNGQTATTQSHAVPSFRLYDVLWNRNERKKITLYQNQTLGGDKSGHREFGSFPGSLFKNIFCHHLCTFALVLSTSDRILLMVFHVQQGKPYAGGRDPVGCPHIVLIYYVKNIFIKNKAKNPRTHKCQACTSCKIIQTDRHKYNI